MTSRTCRIYTDPDVVYAGDCVATVPVAADGSTGGRLVIHHYIMGFIMWNSARTNNSYLYTGVTPDVITVGGDDPRDVSLKKKNIIPQRPEARSHTSTERIMRNFSVEK